MAKQTAGSAKSVAQENEKLQDILLIYDQLGKMLQAVTGVDENGKPKTEPFDEVKNNSFLKIDKMASMMETWWKNLVDQFKDPTLLNLVSIKESDLDNPKIKKILSDLAEGKKNKAVRDFLDKFEIRAKNPEQAAQRQIDWAALEKATGLTRETIEQSGMASAMIKLAAGEQVKVQERVPQAHRYSESLINWQQFEAMGVPKEMLIQKGYLDEMLKGRKTRDLVPMVLELGPAKLRFDARLSLFPGDNGLTMYMNGVRQAPDLDRPFMGHIFSETDKQNLRETNNLGRVVPLKWRDGQTHDSFISIDRLTNDIVPKKASDVVIFDEYSKVKLTEQEIAYLREGKAIRVENLISTTGNEFAATLQYNTELGRVDYRFDNDKLFKAQTLGGAPITDNMREDINAGKAVLVENMISKNGGDQYDRFVKLDDATGKLGFFKYNPDSPEGSREIIIPKELGGVRLTADDRRELAEGKPVYIQDMTFRNGNVGSQWVKSDLRTGELNYASAPDKFEERQTFNVPQQIYGATLSASQRAALQDGKAVEVSGMKGFDGKEITQWVRFDKSSGTPQTYNENPDRKRTSDQRNVIQRNPAPAAKKGQSHN